MSRSHTRSSSPEQRRRAHGVPVMGAVAAAAVAVILAACGGGGGSSADDSAGGGGNTPAATTSYTTGAISGFGSVIVNGVRFDDSSAEIEDDRGRSMSTDDLRLGQRVEIEASEVDREAGTGRAARIVVSNALEGPIESIDVAAGTVVVLGQTVSIGDTTVFDDSYAGGLAALQVGDLVEVHGLRDATSGTYTASRIEAAHGGDDYELRGAVADLDTGAMTFTIGDAQVSYAGVADVPASLANGMLVKVHLQATAVNGVWQATELERADQRPDDHDDADIEGLVTAYTSQAAFSVNGIAVDASGAAFEDGTAGLALGAHVEVEGAIVNGVMIATKVEVKTRDGHDDGGSGDDDNGDDSHGGGDDFELHGSISSYDANAMTFTLRGVQVAVDDQTRFEDGSAAALGNGVRVEVEGVLAADGATLLARKIRFED